MPSTLIVLLVASVIGAAQSQTWAGTYTVKSGCSTSSCCCLTGQATVTSISTNTYSFSSPVTGVCGGATTSSGTFTVSGYTGSAALSGQAFTLSLSSDSQTITVNNLAYPACSGSATKSATQSPTWAGTYTVKPGCSTSSCCCLTGQATVTSISMNTYSFSSPVTGVCGGATTSSGTFIVSGYTGSAALSGQAFTLSLSSDSQTITVNNLAYPACSGSGVRSGAIKQHGNIIMLSFAITLVTMLLININSST